jgi:hypothetical protein
MKEIGILEFEQLVMERLSNPRDFAGRSLVLWNADYNNYGIAYRVIEQCCERYNKENPNNQVWFTESAERFFKDDYTEPETWYSKMVWNEKFKEYVPSHELKRCGILFNKGLYNLDYQDDWLKFVNTHTNQNGGVFQDCAVIVCTHTDDYDYLGPSNPESVIKEEQFGENCDIYHIQPTIEEWAKWAEPFYDAEIVKVVRAYIEKNGVILHFDYWMRIMSALVGLKKSYSKKENKDCSLWQIPEDEVSSKIGGTVGDGHPAPDFCKFIHSFFEDNPNIEPMNPTKKILQILNEHPESLTEWGYESPKEITDGLVFSINTAALHPGWVRVEYDEAEGTYIISAHDTEYGYKHEVGFVQESELFDILDKEIREGLTDEEIEEIRKRWWSEP